MIERLRLRNFRRHLDATLPFRAGMNVIEGPNNVGKTSIFFAVEYALFGRVENFKTIRALMRPGTRSLGVELVFLGKTGERFLLQRIHQSPPKGKKTLEGHFTLKRLHDDGETYLLASDFGDTEDKLALKLQELTGLTRRFFCIALHMRQGEIPSILDGAKQLDIVLGVTAASTAEEELRQMALELEKESATLPVLQERMRSVGNELAQVGAEATAVIADQTATAAKLAALGAAEDPRQELDRKLAPLMKAVGAFEERRKQSGEAQRRLADERERRDEARQSGSKEDAEEEPAKPDAPEESLAERRGQLDATAARKGKLLEQRGDLAGRLERRRGLPKGKGAKCEVCGAPVDAAQTAKELASWTAEIETLDATLAEIVADMAELRKSLDAEEAEGRERLARAARSKERRDKLATLEAKIAERQTESDGASAAERVAFDALRPEWDGAAAILREAGAVADRTLDGDPAEAIAAIREAVQIAKQGMAEKVGRRLAERQALADLLGRFDAQVQSLAKRRSDLEREQAAAKADAATLLVKAARAERCRKISAGFKELQVQIRGGAATKLAEDTIALHRRLSRTDEFTALVIDPAQYSVQVVPRDLDEEVPASLYEGGGHRLLLGLAYRLAVARLAAECPLLMLDEPTYGLDADHRETLLHRLGDAELARQVLLVTHHAGSELAGHRVRMARQDHETVIG